VAHTGGPLLNERGEVVGMNTFLREDLHGLGFAIAIGVIRDTALELLGLQI
jgi:S1-C subfamily serine protease